tara:strand:+ start:54 stop:1568 length:1515 start_codon:yes stop_codon:yes gene_type:complete
MAITKVSPDLLDLDSGITISVADNSDNLTLTSTDADANVGPNLVLYRNSASPADGDMIGMIHYDGENSAGQTISYVKAYAETYDITDGTEDGRYFITTMVGGTERHRMYMNFNETIFNDTGIDLDFRVESDGNANMLFVDGGNNVVSIGGTPIETGDAFNVQDTTSNGVLARFISVNDDAHGAKIILQKNTASPADDDEVGEIDFFGRDSSGNAELYGAIQAFSTDVTSGTEDGKLVLGAPVAGTYNSTLTLEGGTAKIAQSSETAGQLLLRSNYSDPHFLATMGTNNSSGGWYWGYGIEISGSGTTKSTFSNFTGERSLMQLFGNRLELSFAGASNTTIGDEVSISEGMRLDAHGIKFNGDTAAANALDDYEEGTWTPEIDGASGGAYTMGGQNAGRYTKVGDVVVATATVEWTGRTTAYSGHLVLKGYPFACGAVRAAGIISAVQSGLTFSSGTYDNYFAIAIDPGNSFAYIIENGDGTYSHNPTVGTTGRIYTVTITYTIS